MATTTPRIGLTKPDGTDLVDIAVLNTNFDKIDSNIASTKIQSTKPTTANAGDLWWDSDTGTLYLYYTDANSSQWVAATSDPINIGVVASQAERDAQYPTPAQGMSVYRTDLGVTQRYYGLFNVSTNPGGRDTAGWYNTEKSVGLVPIVPTSVTAVTGTASTSSLGQTIFNGVAKVILSNVFSADYMNYKIVVNLEQSTDNSDLWARFSSSGADNGSTLYRRQGVRVQTTTVTAWQGGYENVLYITNTGNQVPSLELTIFDPYRAKTTKALSHAMGFTAGTFVYTGMGGMFDGVTQFDGFCLGIGGGTFSGTVQVFGYND